MRKSRATTLLNDAWHGHSDNAAEFSGPGRVISSMGEYQSLNIRVIHATPRFRSEWDHAFRAIDARKPCAVWSTDFGGGEAR
jgi:hypothetical protein